MQDTEATADRIHKSAVVVVDHDHRPIGPDIPLMRAGGVTAKVYQVTLDVDLEAGYETSRGRTENWLHLATCQMEGALREIDTHARECLLARTAADVFRAKTDGRIAILLGTEGTRWLEQSLEPLRLFYRLGLRELQLTWAFPNPVVSDGRLNTFGRQVVCECERLGILVDLTHIPRNAFDDVIGLAQNPVIVSHGAAQRVTTDLADDQIRALAATGGLIGIHFFTTYLGPAPSPMDVVKQVDHIAQLVGIDHIALGVDFFPTQGPWRDLQVAQGTTDLRWAIDDLGRMPRITHALVKHGLCETDIRKILGENFLRVCQAVFVT